MESVEIELKIIQAPEEVEKILLNQGFTIHHKVRTVANYYTNQQFSPLGLDLKEKSVRIRTSSNIEHEPKNKKIKFSIRNSGYLCKRGTFGQNEQKFSLAKTKRFEKKLLKKNFKLVLTDDKTDYVYFHPDFENNKIAFQIQNIKGLDVIVAYDNSLYTNLSADKQRKKLIEDVKNFGIEIESETQVNRYESLLKNPYKIFIKEINIFKNEV